MFGVPHPLKVVGASPSDLPGNVWDWFRIDVFDLRPDELCTMLGFRGSSVYFEVSYLSEGVCDLAVGPWPQPGRCFDLLKGGNRHVLLSQ